MTNLLYLVPAAAIALPLYRLLEGINAALGSISLPF